jgi:hypothetical protein
VIRSLFRISRKEYFSKEKKRDENEKKRKNIYIEIWTVVYIYIKKKIAVKRFFELGMRVGVTGIQDGHFIALDNAI